VDSFIGLGSNEALWSIPVDDAHSPLEIATSPQMHPSMSLGHLLEPGDIPEPLDAPIYQSSVLWPATRAHHSGNPRPPRFRSNGAYHAKSTADDLGEDLFGDAVAKSNDDIDPLRTAGEYVCLMFGCPYKTQAYSELM
jgi:hypothetical protein